MLTLTTADNLAFYFLGKWIQVHGGFYPDRPRTNDIPQSAPSTRKRDVTASPDAPIVIVNGQVGEGNLTDLAEALGADSPADAENMFVYEDPDIDCLDLVGPADNVTTSCYTTDTDTNAALDLDAGIGYPQVTPTESDAGPNPTGCVYTVSSMAGVTSTGYYTIQPTVATMCLCDSTVFAGIATSTDAASTSYLVCEVPSSIVVSTMPPSTAQATPTPTPDMSSPACVSCMDDQGASTCAADDPACLVQACKDDTNCQSCGIDCNTYNFR